MSKQATVSADVLLYQDAAGDTDGPMARVSAEQSGITFTTMIFSGKDGYHFFHVSAHWPGKAVGMPLSLQPEQIDALIVSLVRARAIAARAGVLP